MWRRAILQGFEKEPKSGARFFVGHAESVEDLLLDILTMNTNGTRSQLGSIQHNVVGQSAYRAGIREQFAEVLLVGRCERMMRRIPAAFLVVIFEHRKVSDPQEAIVIRRAGFVECAVLVF